MNEPTAQPLETRVAAAKLALDGLSIGDAFGQQFFDHATWMHYLPQRRAPEGTWYWTDDTEMAISIERVLREHGHIDQDALAAGFVERYEADSHKGYGYGMHALMEAIHNGTPWREAARSLFGEQGSYGNGGSMRVAPVGGYFADDYEMVVEQAALSASVTHAHPEGQAGAIAVAIAAAWAYNQSNVELSNDDRRKMILTAIRFTPEGHVRDGLQRAMKVSLDATSREAAEELGDGSRITAMDTVPFCLWAAAANVHSYEAAMWATVSVGGDIDTNAAIVGGIVALHVGASGIPDAWRRSRGGLA